MRIDLEEDKKRFVMFNDDGGMIGEIDWDWDARGQLLATHTGVDSEYSGQGLGYALLERLVGYAREKKAKIVPLCPFVKAAFIKHPDRYGDVDASPQSTM